MRSDGVYDSDVLAWSERQANLLRQIAAGERLSDAVDWPHVIEEVEGVGRSQLSSVKSWLVQAVAHELKCRAWPAAPYVPHWRAEARAAEALTAAMRPRIEVAEIYRRALGRLPDSVDGQASAAIPPVCPLTLEDLLADAAVGRWLEEA